MQDFGGLEGIGLPLANEFVYEVATTYVYNLHAAVSMCLQRYEAVVSLLSHYGETVGLPEVVYVVLPSQRALTYSVRENRISSSQGEISAVVDAFVQLSNSSRVRLEKVFRQTRLAYETNIPEIQFSNLWVALEALVTGGDMDSGIESLRVVIPAVLTASYVFRIVSNFLSDLRRCGVQPVYKGHRITTENPDALSITNMIQLFREPAEFRELLSLISGHTLLTSRASWLKNAFATDATISELLRKHNSRLAWHLQRLYRARNNLVHAAEATAVAPLIRHLNSYLRDVVNEILVKSRGEQEEIDELLTKMSDNYSTLLEMLDESTGDASAPWYWSWLLNGPLFDNLAEPYSGP